MNTKHAVPVYSDPAVQYLMGLGKAVLIDALIDALRTHAHRDAGAGCDDLLTVAEAERIVGPIASWRRTNGMGQPIKVAQ